MHLTRCRLALSVFVVVLPGLTALAEVSLPSLIGDNMVLQQGAKCPLWGRADPGEGVTVTLDGRDCRTMTGPDGRWTVRLPAHKPGGPFEITIRGRNTLVLKNVMFGEVWICSGQSNMEMHLRDVQDGAAEVAAADHSGIRLFRVPHTACRQPSVDARGNWVVCSPAAAERFSAVGYYFGRELHRRLGVPVGLIDASWGGTLAEVWTTPETLGSNAELAPILEWSAVAVASYPEAFRRYEGVLRKWQSEHPDWRGSFQHDEGNRGEGLGYAHADFNAADWTPIRLPSNFEGIIDVNGAFWFRKEVEIPAAWAGRDLTITLGPIDDLDITYFNGQQIGATGKEGDQTHVYPRQYTVPAALVQAGRAVVAVRVFDHFGRGGFSGSPQDMQLTPGGEESLSLAGMWTYKIEKALDPARVKPLPAGMPGPPSLIARLPGQLFNGMIHPLLGYGFRGAIWYQGESNADRAEQYRWLLPAMIGDWRRGAGRDFPFLIVQLPTYGGGTSWAELREAQAMTVRHTPGTALAVTLDIPDGALHPKIKLPVGERLALAALKTAYGRKIVASGPTYQAMKVRDKTVRLTFDNVGGGLAVGSLSKDQSKDAGPELKGFVIAGADRKFVQASAAIEGNRVVVWSVQVPRPVAVRYAFSNGASHCNLVNKEGLPCGTFRTDDWPVETTGQR